MQKNIHSWLHLNSIYGFGSSTIRKILTKFSKPELFLQLDKSSLQQFGCNEEQIKQIRTKPKKLFLAVDKWCQPAENNLICLYDDLYPAQLKNIPDPPVLLFVRGSVHALSQQQIAIVGSRNPSAYGKGIAYDFAAQLAMQRLSVCSGLAIGIDTCAHKGALDATGVTVAVMGCGLNYIYPKRNKKLAENIITAGGALVSEFLPDEQPAAANFPRRNRIVSGLSLGTLVVEAAIKSGSLITANLAAEQGRTVMAIPGSIYNDLSTGCHVLLREGGSLVRNVKDVIYELNLTAINTNALTYCKEKQKVTHESTDKDCSLILDTLECGNFCANVIVQMTGISVKKAMICLHKLKLAGKVIEAFGVYQKK